MQVQGLAVCGRVVPRAALAVAIAGAFVPGLGTPAADRMSKPSARRRAAAGRLARMPTASNACLVAGLTGIGCTGGTVVRVEACVVAFVVAIVRAWNGCTSAKEEACGDGLEPNGHGKSQPPLQGLPLMGTLRPRAANQPNENMPHLGLGVGQTPSYT